MKKSFIFEIIIITLIFLLILFFALEKSKIKNFQPPSPNFITQPTFTPIGEIYGFPAIVSSIGENYLILVPYRAQLKYDSVKVFIGPNTVIREISLKNALIEDETSEPKIREVSFSDIRPGDEVAVSARENIAERKEFEANIINIIKREK